MILTKLQRYYIEEHIVELWKAIVKDMALGYDGPQAAGHLLGKLQMNGFVFDGMNNADFYNNLRREHERKEKHQAND